MMPPVLRPTAPETGPHPIIGRLATVAAWLICLAPTPLMAQQSEVAGTVVDGSSLTPLPLVRVAIAGSNSAISTDERGRFRLTGVSGSSITLTFQRIGYQPKTETVKAGAADLRITLTPAPTRLEEVVVTGTAEAVQKRTIGNAVSTIS